MVKQLRFYFEGDETLRPGFNSFLKEIKEAASSKGWEFEAVATNGTPAKDYLTALKTHRRALNVLLLDSDEPPGLSSARLQGKKGLKGCDSKCIFWMVEVMESWFLADIEALQKRYKGGFNRKAIKVQPNVEKVRKVDVISQLETATRRTKAGKYQKSHAFKLLGLIDPVKVRKAAPHCQRMFSIILAKLG